MRSRCFPLPKPILDLICARNSVRDHYREFLVQSSSGARLDFTLDGKFVGDLGKAIAAQYFQIVLISNKSSSEIYGLTPNERTVQIKATGTGRGPAFGHSARRADHLLFFDFDYESCSAKLIFNGPEEIAFSYLPQNFVGTRSLTRNQILEADTKVLEDDRLHPISG